MKLQTKNLTGAALDWCVARCEGYEAEPQSDEGFWLEHATATPTYLHNYTPSTNWAQGGPLIQQEQINIITKNFLEDVARKWMAYREGDAVGVAQFGPTPLIAAMRCYVASKLGAEVEVPNELQTKE